MNTIRAEPLLDLDSPACELVSTLFAASGSVKLSERSSLLFSFLLLVFTGAPVSLSVDVAGGSFLRAALLLIIKVQLAQE